MLGVIFSTSVQDIVLIDYENKLKEVENNNNNNNKGKRLCTWPRRNITGFGKITVINTLVISKINHQFMNVPDPDEKILHDLNLLLYEFLFDGKYDKIKVSVVCQAPAAGGLKMVDVKSFLSAFKIGWLK